ncbi:MAG: hypothetical protein A2Z29_11425 [Chloroflexi bacterium RBG_16_56_11]|nr:MAG: hypothetical protein A2Z29_11425 [Chloroflexi bacterium RBG_16_56_11]
MDVKFRKYNENDYNRAFNFFRDLYRASDNVPFWLPSRWEYADYLVSPLFKDRGSLIDWKETIYLWETDNGTIVAILCSENPDENIFIHTKPEFRYLEEEMITVAEERIISGNLNQTRISIWCQSGDPYRELILQKRGYKKQIVADYLNWRDLDEPLREIKMPEGYTLQNMVSEEGLDLRHKISRMTGAFGSPKPYPVEIYRNMQSGPSYRREFDLYTKDSGGNVTSFCIIWYDEELNIGYFEPVGTDASHRHKGLGRATLNAGLRCLKQAGVSRAYVGSFGDERMSFYRTSGFTSRLAFHPWTKELEKG